jgi:hypothetical protein
MQQAARDLFTRLVPVSLAAVPVIFGLVRAIQTGSDFRYIVCALAALAAAGVVFRVLDARSTPRWQQSALALAAATVAAAALAYAQGARSVPAVWLVALGFGTCIATGGAFGAFGRRHAR